MTLLEEILRAIQGKTKQEASVLIEQILREKEVYDAFKFAGLTLVTPDDVQARARERSGIMTLLEKVNLIDLIETINLINLIKVIDEINVIHKIDNVGEMSILSEIVKVDLVEKLNPQPIGEVIVNGTWETGDFTGWTETNSLVTNQYAHSGTYSCRIYSGWVKQTFADPIPTNNVQSFTFWGMGQVANNYLKVHFTDGSSINVYVPMDEGSWQQVDVKASLPANKEIDYIQFIGQTGGPSWIDDISLQAIYNAVIDLVKKAIVEQSSRTSLKMQPEREDTIFKRFSNTFGGAGDYEILSAVANQKHKVYSYGVRVSADVESEFRDGTSDTNQFSVDNKASFREQVLEHPFVGSVNTALHFRVEGACSVIGWIQYKTEA